MNVLLETFNIFILTNHSNHSRTEKRIRATALVFNATFNNILVISWWSVLLVGKTAEYPETPDLPQTIVMLYRVHLARYNKLHSISTTHDKIDENK